MGEFTSCGRFECSYKEVVARIESLICNGYMKRKVTQPQILVYLPLPEEERGSMDHAAVDITKREQLTLGIHNYLNTGGH